MKVKVLQEFRDKHTKRDYKVGQILEITDERYEEIVSYSKKLIRKVNHKVKKEEVKKEEVKK